MLVGEPPYPGATAQAVLGRIIAGEPVSATKQRPSIPANVDAAIRCALEKLPADRFKSAAQFAEALTNPAYTLPTAAGTAAVVQQEAPLQRHAATLAAVATVTTLLALWGWLRPSPEPLRPVSRYSVALPEAAVLGSPQLPHFAFVPDGTRWVYVGLAENAMGQLLIRASDQLHASPIPGTGNGLVLCSQSLFRFADLGDDGLCRGGPDKGCGVIVSAIDVVVDRLD